MGVAYCFLASAQSNCAHLQGITPEAFIDYLDYLLGRFCYAMRGASGDGSALPGPSWQLVLNYEYEIRTHAMVLCRKGALLHEALVQAYKDPIVKERFFSTPLSREAASAPRAPPPSMPRIDSGLSKGAKKRAEKRKRAEESQGPFRGGGHGGGAGGGKGSGKGRGGGRGAGSSGGRGGNSAPPGCKVTTGDGKPICFRFNSAAGCAMTACRFAHVCGICCASGHTMATCPSK